MTFFTICKAVLIFIRLLRRAGIQLSGLRSRVKIDATSGASSDEKTSRILDALVCQASNNPQALATLAHALAARGEDERARALAFKARELAPGNSEVALLTAEVLSAGIPEWHFSIVRDTARNAAFDFALRRAVRPGMRVLDIGSGTGLLAMMAVRAGAAEVVSCEMNPAIAGAALKIVAANGYARSHPHHRKTLYRS